MVISIAPGLLQVHSPSFRTQMLTQSISEVYIDAVNIKREEKSHGRTGYEKPPVTPMEGLPSISRVWLQPGDSHRGGAGLFDRQCAVRASSIPRRLDCLRRGGG